MHWVLCDIKLWMLLATILIILCLRYIYKKVRYWKDRGINTPVVDIWTFIKEARKFMKKPFHQIQMENYSKYGRIYGTFLGIIPQISVAEPDILKRILVKDFHMFHNRLILKLGEPLLDKMLVFVEDEDWKRIRCVMSPTFTSNRMRRLAYLVRECAEKFTENLRKMVRNDELIDCKKYFSHFSIDVISSTAFGTKLSSLNDPRNEFVEKARKITNTDSPFFFIFIFLFPALIRFINLDKVNGGMFMYFKKFASHVIQQRDKAKKRGNDFLQLMVDAQRGIVDKPLEDIKEEEEKQQIEILPKNKTMSMDEMFAQCSMFLFVGNESMTNTLAYVMYFLALNPDCQEKIICEIENVWKTNTDITFDDVNNMPYLNAVISETLRKEPIITQLVRTCTEDCEINGIKFSKETSITVPIYAMHHDPEFFPDPETFDPERFMPENINSIPQYVYLPFGEGPRNCIGMRFAMMVMKMCIVHILRQFRIIATEETKKPLEFYIGKEFLQPKNIRVRLEDRK